MEALDSEFVVPMVTYLVSDQRALYSVGDRCFARAVVDVTRGWIPGGETPSPEGLVEHLDPRRGAFRVPVERGEGDRVGGVAGVSGAEVPTARQHGLADLLRRSARRSPDKT